MLLIELLCALFSFSLSCFLFTCGNCACVVVVAAVAAAVALVVHCVDSAVLLSSCCCSFCCCRCGSSFFLLNGMDGSTSAPLQCRCNASLPAGSLSSTCTRLYFFIFKDSVCYAYRRRQCDVVIYFILYYTLVFEIL